MSKGRFEKNAQRRSFSGKAVALMLACVLLIGCVVGGTVAWLTAKTNEVTNVFTTSDINISLQEHKYDATNDKLMDEETHTGVDNYKMVPGWTIPKDPWLTVKKDSEDCWLFIKVEEKGGDVTVGSTACSFENFIAYKIDDNNWNQLKDELGNVVEGVYYCYAKDITSDRNIKILAGGEYEYDGVTYTWEPNQVLTKPEVTKEMMNAVKTDNKPTLTFTAYASQYWKNNTTAFEAIEAWNNVSGN